MFRKQYLNMDFIKFYFLTFILIIISHKGHGKVQLGTNGAITAVLGNNTYQLTCTHSGLTESQIDGLSLKFVKDGVVLVAVPPLSFSGGNVSVNATLSSRLSVVRFTANNPTTTVTFQSIECGDEGTYTWEGYYYDLTIGNTQVSQTYDIKVKALPVLVPEKSEVSFTPNTNLAVGDNVTFTCSGDVGNNPIGVLAWFYYKEGDPSPVDKSKNAISTAPQDSRVCSKSRSSTLELTLTKEMNNMVVRCTVQQDIRTPDGEGHIQTNGSLNVHFKPVILSLVRFPEQTQYTEGMAQLILTCIADGNPLPSYYWMYMAEGAGNGTMLGSESQYTLNNLTLEGTGIYTCVAYNEIKGINQTVNASTQITINKSTTVPPTTTPQSTTTDSSNVTKKPGGSTGNDDGESASNAGLIGGIVGGLCAVIIIAIIVVVCYIRKNKKAKEIEEPPEKPRKPDLVVNDHNLRNNMALNSSFNNSFDSTSDIKRDDGLTYIDLQFDDKPRSRRPIQLYDNPPNGQTPYADIGNMPTMPRV
ncbi:uncharacterized protein LOC128234335 [Mya arenaria]|uniref:uncharacterized protein LOC128234335 n=1 Tax=Mya arenaria TaxID=6604 RepID=UPI0022E19715|nr:uncharacterized protein LOC128234335 [Mya arenaria]